MASNGNSTIGSLPRANVIGDTDLLVLEQVGEAKSVRGRELISQLLAYVNDHGGVQAVTFDSTDSQVFMNVIVRDGTTWTSPNIKGLTGDTPTISGVKFAKNETYETAPLDSEFVSVQPYVPSGQYLWERIDWSNGQKTYINTRMGIDGDGAVDSVNEMSGDVVLTASNINYDSTTTIEEKIDAKADLVSGKVPLSQLPVWDGTFV